MIAWTELEVFQTEGAMTAFRRKAGGGYETLATKSLNAGGTWRKASGGGPTIPYDARSVYLWEALDLAALHKEWEVSVWKGVSKNGEVKARLEVPVGAKAPLPPMITYWLRTHLKRDVFFHRIEDDGTYVFGETTDIARLNREVTTRCLPSRLSDRDLKILQQRAYDLTTVTMDLARRMQSTRDLYRRMLSAKPPTMAEIEAKLKDILVPEGGKVGGYSLPPPPRRVDPRAWEPGDVAILERDGLPYFVTPHGLLLEIFETGASIGLRGTPLTWREEDDTFWVGDLSQISTLLDERHGNYMISHLYRDLEIEGDL